MTRFEIKLWRIDNKGRPRVFVVGDHTTDASYAHGASAKQIANALGKEYPRHGNIEVRRIGGGDRAVLNRP